MQLHADKAITLNCQESPAPTSSAASRTGKSTTRPVNRFTKCGRSATKSNVASATSSRTAPTKSAQIPAATNAVLTVAHRKVRDCLREPECAALTAR
jgi:hypothetical protein